jgi:hypothetical protein
MMTSKISCNVTIVSLLKYKNHCNNISVAIKMENVYLDMNSHVLLMNSIDLLHWLVISVYQSHQLVTLISHIGKSYWLDTSVSYID